MANEERAMNEDITISVPGGVLKLSGARKALERSKEIGETERRMCLDILSALVAVLNVPETEETTVANDWDKGYEHGYAARGRDARKAAGVLDG